MTPRTDPDAPAATRLPAIDRPPNLALQVEKLLRQAIAEGRYPDGKLPTEVDLAEQFGVSRETVRQAQEVLQKEGMLVKIRRRGTFLQKTAQTPDRTATAGVGVILYLQAGYPSRDGEEAVTPTTGLKMLQGAIEEASRAGLGITVHQSLFTEVGKTVQDLQGRQNVRGVVFASYGEEKLLKRVTAWGMPAVLLDHSLPRASIPSVNEDSLGGARLAVHHLAELGHRQIAFMNWHQTELNPWRLQGYRQELREVGLPRRRAWELAVELTPAGAVRAAKQFLALAPRPTAVYCFNNTLARLFIEALATRRVRVPEDVSVVGGGGDDVPGLTCHQADWYGLGRKAVEVLLRSGTDARKPEHYLGPHELIEGRSTAARE